METIEDSKIHALPIEEDSVRPERAAPERIGRYELCFELASGGMASVYLARIDGASGFEKLVALKRIHRHLAKEKGYVEMFLDEAKIASRVTHPNVCSVFDFGEADGEYYIAMEYLVGESLSRLCSRVAKSREQRRDALLPLRMGRIIADACEGLHAAHELKDANGDSLHVVHRDVSPRNLFVTYDGAVQVVDFGIASARQRLHHTSTGQVKGTFAYMAPEQLTSSPIDRRVDIWALGVALWEMLAVKRLFRRETTASTIHAVLYDEVKPPSSHRSQVPKELDEIVMKALARDRAERFQSAREMGRAIRRFLGSQPHIIGPAELSEWMTELFPQGEARKSQLMEVARLSDATVPAIPTAEDSEATVTGTDPVVNRGLAARITPSRPRLLELGALGAILVMVFALVFALRGGDEPPEREAGRLPAVTPSESSPGAIEPLALPDDASRGDARATAPDADLDALRAASAERVPNDDDSAGVELAVPRGKEEAKRAGTKRSRSKSKVRGRPGTINLVTRGGWATIFDGKKSLGTTPRRLTLPAGRHRLVLRPFGDGAPKPVLVQVEAGKTKQISVRLD